MDGRAPTLWRLLGQLAILCSDYLSCDLCHVRSYKNARCKYMYMYMYIQVCFLKVKFEMPEVQTCVLKCDACFDTIFCCLEMLIC